MLLIFLIINNTCNIFCDVYSCFYIVFLHCYVLIFPFLDIIYWVSAVDTWVLHSYAAIHAQPFLLSALYISIYIYIYITVLIKSIFYMFWYYISWLYITVAYQAVQSLGFSRQECWSGLPFPSPGDLPPPRNRTQVSRIAGRRFTVWATREALYIMIQVEKPTILGISQIIKSWKARGA